tara:strand:+ start:440 stop:1057 length:618 start_codon:yes stop_codon:yes gene_type:complete
MKKLLVLLFSLIFLSSTAVFADDISDFEIEGISIGDSLLDYMSEDEILKEIERKKNAYYYLNEPNKYGVVYLSKDLLTFENLSFIVTNTPTSKYITNKNKNEKYIILFVRGILYYEEDFDGCIAKRDEIAEELSMMFPNAQKTENVFTTDEGTINDDVRFMFDSGDEVVVRCADLEENYRIKNNFSEGLSIAIETKEIYEWLSDY